MVTLDNAVEAAVDFRHLSFDDGIERQRVVMRHFPVCPTPFEGAHDLRARQVRPGGSSPDPLLLSEGAIACHGAAKGDAVREGGTKEGGAKVALRRGTNGVGCSVWESC